MPLPTDYAERVYAGVLGKIIGVYLGRPFEQWSHERILAELGEIWYYVHEKRNTRLIVTDDDISGTFTFLRALPDYDNSPNLTPAQIGQTWLNYIIENKAILWWGGLGNSTEHTAFLRLKQGIPAPESGSIARNGRVVAEQIGSQIFIDGWGLISPGDPAQAADFARRAASVSHDGEAIYGAQIVAALVAQAFVESDINTLLDTAVSQIPNTSLIYRMIGDIREWHSKEPDWRKTYANIAAQYNYEKFGGGCHMIPNHALIIHALLHGDGDFQKSLMIVNTCGWDTDCNSGNVGCILGVRNGLAGIDDGPDWRGPVADQIYLPTADGGRCITDAPTEALRIVAIGRSLAGEPPLTIKDGARFHFDLPGSVQGFRPDDSIEAKGVATLENVPGHSATGQRSLAIHYNHLATGRVARVLTPTFVSPDAAKMAGYALLACPTVYSGQTVRASVSADTNNARAANCRLVARVYTSEDKPALLHGPEGTLAPGATAALAWTLPDTDGQPIFEIGLELAADKGASGTVYLDLLGWDGIPNVTFNKPAKGEMWKRAWVSSVDRHETWGDWGDPYRLVHDAGVGLLIQGCREWTDYKTSVTLTPHLVASTGIAIRVQGMKRYYALLLNRKGKVQLVKELDGTRVLAETDFDWQFGQPYALELLAVGNRLTASVDGKPLFDVTDAERPLTGGAFAFIVEEGRISARAPHIQPAD